MNQMTLAVILNGGFTKSTQEADAANLEPLWGPKRDPLYIVVPVTVLYSLIFLTGVVGNVCTCIVIAQNRHMHTATNYYLFSLAISDLLLLMSGLPTEMYTLWSKYPYVFGETFCVISGLASETSSNATVLTITAFTVERYVAICHPFLTHTFSKLSRAIKFVIAIWLVALSCAVPQAAQMGLVYAEDEIGNKVSEEYKICGMKNPYPYAFEMSTVVFFFAPMSVITILYVLIGMKLHRSASRKSGQRLRDSRKCSGYGTTRVVKMLVVVVVAFFICWAPFQAQRLFALYGANTSTRMILMYKAITYMSGLLYYLSTTINPFLYNIMSLKFREAFKSTLTRCVSRDIRSEVVGSSGGGVAPRFNYSVLSHRSARNSNNSNNNNNSFSSGNSYIEQGADELAKILTGKVEIIIDDGLNAESRLGWSLILAQADLFWPNLTYLCLLNFSIKDLRDLETLGIEDVNSSEQVVADAVHLHEFFTRNIKIDEEGMHEVKLPWKPLSTRLPTNFKLAEKRLHFTSEVDLHRRPLVVSFKRRSATVSLDYICPHQKDFLHVPMRKFHSPLVVRQQLPHKAPPKTPPAEKRQQNGSPKIPMIEDIEIFHESRMKIERKRGRKKGEEAQSYSIEEKKTVSEIETNDDSLIVRKSYTAPCLMIK